MAWVTALQVTLIVFEVTGALQLAAGPAGGGQRQRVRLPLTAGGQVDHPVGARPRRARGAAHAQRGAHDENDEEPATSQTRHSSSFSGASSPGRERTDQLVQLSVAGLVVEVAAPPVAVTPVKDGREK